MNEDRVMDMSNKFEQGINRLEKVITISKNDHYASTLDANYVEHSFGGIPIPKAPKRDAGVSDMSGLVVTEVGDQEDLLLAS
jgi:hypothetical protein